MLKNLGIENSSDAASRQVYLAVMVAALGYFVDIFDLLLFGIVRVQSLKDLGVHGEGLLTHGIFLLNMQMVGLLLGGVLWGILGDKLGRIQVLFGSILMYSTANILNAFVWDVQSYAILRFISGIGLAGELGVGITLVTELVAKETRGLATAFVATVGVSGAVAAGLVSQYLDWRTSYFLGGCMGIALLFLRVGVNESGIFKEVAAKDEIRKGDLRLLLRPKLAFRFLSCILIGTPIWFIVGIIVTFSPEIGTALKLDSTIVASQAIALNYIGLTLGDLLSGLTSQLLKSRKKAIFIFATAALICSAFTLSFSAHSATTFYFCCTILGIFSGYWAMFITTAAEQFGTNIRATVTTSTPNFVRGAVVPMTMGFTYLKPDFGVIASAQIVGAIVFALGFTALLFLKETFGADMDFVEK